MTKFGTRSIRPGVLRMTDVQSVQSVYTKYTLGIIGDIWSNVCTKFGTRSIRPVIGGWLTYTEVYDLDRTYSRLTQHIVRVHQVHPMYHRGLWSNVCTKFGRRSIRSGVWRKANVQ